jgi:hypothetical protein
MFRHYRGRRDPFSCFARPDSFWAVLRAPGPVFMFCAHGPSLGGNECVGSSFHVLRPRTRFQRYQGRQVSSLCFLFSDSFLAVTRASGLVFLFYASGLIFGGTKGVRSCCLVLRSHTHFRRNRGHRVPLSYFTLRNSFGRYLGRWVLFSYFALPYSFFQRYYGCWILFSCFTLQDSFWAVQWAASPVFMFCAP